MYGKPCAFLFPLSNPQEVLLQAVAAYAVAAQLGWFELCNSVKRDRVVRPYRPLSNACGNASALGPVSQ